MTKDEKIDTLVKWETETLGVDIESALDFVLRFGHWGYENLDEHELDEYIKDWQEWNNESV